MGLFCYDADGNFLDTIIEGAYSKEKSALTPANSDSNANHMMFYVHSDNLSGYLGGVSVAGDYCLSLTREGEVNMLSFYHIPTKTKSADTDKDRTNLNFYNLSSVNLPLKRPFSGGISVFLNQETYLVEELDPLNEQPTFLSSFGMFGDTLCRFSDHVPKVKVQTVYASGADLGFPYIFNGQYTVSQQYCDTVFRMTADNCLMPVYGLDFGEKRADKRTDFGGDKSGKLLLYQWKERNKFIYLVYTENHDSPNTREKDEVKFFYAFMIKLLKSAIAFRSKRDFPKSGC